MDFLFNLMGKLDMSGTIIILIILGTFLASFIINLLIHRRYITIWNNLENRQQRRAGIFKIDLLNKIIEDYKKSALNSRTEVNTQAIIEKCFDSKLSSLILGERFVKSTVPILIVLGLLGTFLGLTISVGELVNLLHTTSGSELMSDYSSILDGLISSVSGMAVAFATSLFGIGCSIILTILNIIIDVEKTRETLMVNIEEYLDNTVAVDVAKDKETEYTMLNRILRDTFVEFGEKIHHTLKETVENFGDKLTNVVMDVSVSSQVLDNTVERFDLSLKNFAENIRDFSEFNFNLRNNIERMDVSFIKVTEALKDTSKIIVDNYSLIESFSKDIKTAADELTAYNRQVLNDIGSLVTEIKTTVSTSKELSETLIRDMNNRAQDIQQYQEKFNSLMTKLSDEISGLGHQTADAFASSLEENGKRVSDGIVNNVKDALREVFVLLDTFKENERNLAKTIAILPDQTLAYNESAALRLDRQLSEIKETIEKLDRV
ncbi:MAG: hypothetical protein ACOX7R_13270 [Acetivibrionales bacterium]|jgi:predicted  nucleic acid-binding Zn-ribbon protein